MGKSIPYTTFEEKLSYILERVNKTEEATYNDTPCWIWNRSYFENGYGQISVKCGESKAHRETYKLFKGEIPKDLVIDHLCRNRGCCNPEHLEAVSHLENVRRGGRGLLAPTHCPQGHEYTEDNIMIRPGSKEGLFRKYCRECHRIRGDNWTILRRERRKKHESTLAR